MKQLDLITQKICPKYPRPAKFSDPGGDFSDEELKELVGHTPLEVFFGFVLGIAMGLLFALI